MIWFQVTHFLVKLYQWDCVFLADSFRAKTSKSELSTTQVLDSRHNRKEPERVGGEEILSQPVVTATVLRAGSAAGNTMFSCFSRQIPTTAFAAPVVSLGPMTTSYKPQIWLLDLSLVSFQVTFSLFSLWHSTAVWDLLDEDLRRAEAKHHGIGTTDLCPPLFSPRAFALGPMPIHLQLHLRAVPLHRRGFRDAPSHVCRNHFSSGIHLHFFSHDLASSCCISDSLPPHSISCLTSAEIIFWLQILWVSHHALIPPVWMSLLHGTLQQPAPPGMGIWDTELQPSLANHFSLSRNSNLTESNPRVSVTLWK